MERVAARDSALLDLCIRTLSDVEKLADSHDPADLPAIKAHATAALHHVRNVRDNRGAGDRSARQMYFVF